MRLYLIARIIRTDMRWATHYRVYDYESGEIRDAAVKDLIAAMIIKDTRLLTKHPLKWVLLLCERYIT